MRTPLQALAKKVNWLHSEYKDRSGVHLFTLYAMGGQVGSQAQISPQVYRAALYAAIKDHADLVAATQEVLDKIAKEKQDLFTKQKAA